jgi:molecular chaperone DnaK (HSP70)
LALILRHLLTTVDEGKWKPENAQIVFAVEPVLPFEERLAIGEAVKLANAALTQIIDSPTAAATTYALEKRMLYADGAKTVVFIDIGATHTWTSVCRFIPRKDKPEVDVLAVDFNYSLGGNLMDQQIADDLIRRFEKAHNLKVDDARVRKQFYNEATRAKELLTMNDAVDIRMEDIMGDHRISHRLTRVAFETMIADIAESVCTLYLSVVNKSGLDPSAVDSIELLGGATRVPLIKDALLNTSKLAKLNRTMNSDEAIALGAAYVGASKSSAFIVSSVVVRPFAGINVSLDTKNGLRPLFAVDDRTTEERLIPIAVSDLGDQAIVVGDNRTTLVTFTANLPEQYSERDEVVLAFGFTNLLVPDVINATINGTAITVAKKYPLGLSRDDFETSREFIHSMSRILRDRERLQQTKSDFEGYLYRIKDRLEHDAVFARVMTSAEKEDLRKAVEEQLVWFETGDNITSAGVKARHKDVKQIARQPEIRAEQLTKRGPAMTKLNSTLTMVHRLLNVTWRIWKTWLPENKTEQVWRLYNATKEWYEEREKLIKMARDWDEPIVTEHEIVSKSNELERLARRVNATDKPKTPRPAPNRTAANRQKTNQTNVNETTVSDAPDGGGDNLEAPADATESTAKESTVPDSSEGAPPTAESTGEADEGGGITDEGI